ncbi:conjugal transfer protein TraN [Thiobacillus denitrificans]|mgnify:CR=1 FL=1|uniref:conjugal transfer protein TraN n=1 Tax=Thiobacillus denitrificans TaxID=36861 RepID=UPI00036FD4DE|nr:conjugal transfer protein TraN [Thiobacillus denitrificans]
MMFERIRRFAAYVCLAASLFHVNLVMAAECQKVGTVCLDTTSSKIVDGVTVTLADVGGCWQSTDTYDCVDHTPGAINTCSQLQQYGCYDNAQSTCATMAFNGTCLDWKVDYRCPDQLTTVPTDVTYDRIVYTMTKNDQVDGCAEHLAANNCVLDTQTCLEPAETRNINGLDVYKDCWRWDKTYRCVVPDPSSPCQTLESDPNCTLKDTTCDQVSSLLPGGCALTTKTFDCLVSSDPDQTITNCGGTSFCLDGTSTCFDTNYEPDKDFATAVTMTEIAREAGNYLDRGTMTVFNGTQSWCRDKVLYGLGDCCDVDAQGGQQNNQNVLGQMAYSAVGSLAWEGVEYVGYSVGSLFGSYYVYDALFMNDMVPNWIVDGYASATNLIGAGGSTYSFNPSFGAYGLSATYGSVSATTLGTTNYVLTTQGGFVAAGDTAAVTAAGGPASVGGFEFAFNPYMFAIAIVIMVVMSYLDCDEPEMELAMKRGANLCHRVGSWCSNDTWLGCEEDKTGWCCYNSKLSRIINEQGRAQFGKGWNTPQNPDCSGFTLEQLTQMDFSTFDFSEFYADIQQQAINQAGLESIVNSHAQSISDTFKTKYNNYFSK